VIAIWAAFLVIFGETAMWTARRKDRRLRQTDRMEAS
jgi:hypothetical protein